MMRLIWFDSVATILRYIFRKIYHFSFDITTVPTLMEQNQLFVGSVKLHFVI
jgi:hypothetical protein